MRAIIIEDKDSKALLDQLALAKFGDVAAHTCERLKDLPLEIQRQEVIKEVHARFHYVVCRWLQEQGANCVR
jgi:hypothetical protein